MSDGSGTSNQLSATPQANRVVLPGADILSITTKRRTSLVSKTQTVIVAEYLPGNFEISFEMYLFGVRLVDIDLAHNRDIVNGLPNYDIMPASISNVGIGEAAEELPNGTVRPHWLLAIAAPWTLAYSADVALPGKYYAYVPTQSAQNLPISFTPSTSIAGFDTDGGVLSNAESISPPPAYQGPTASQNHDHVSFTPQLVTFFLDGVLNANLSASPVGFLGSQLNFRYNFGEANPGVATPDFLAGQLTVGGSGAIHVNADARIFDMDNLSSPFINAGPFAIALTDGECAPLADVTMENGSTFVLGGSGRAATVTALPQTRLRLNSGSSLVVNPNTEFRLLSKGPDDIAGVAVESGGLIEVRATPAHGVGRFLIAGGILRIKSGGTLRISRAARVEVLNGGRIILEPGANVQFVDPENPNQSDGVVYVGPGGKLELQGAYNWSGPGYLHLDDPKAIAGTGELKLIGNGNSYRRLQTDVLVTLGASQSLRLHNLKFLAEDGGIAVNGGGKLRVTNSYVDGGWIALATDGLGETLVRTVTFVGSATGFALDAITPSALQSTLIWYCDFIDNDLGIQLYGPGRYATASYHPYLRDCNFTDCATGINVIGLDWTSIDNPVFSGYVGRAINAADFNYVHVRGGSASGGGEYVTLVDVRNGGQFVLERGQYTNAEHGVVVENATLDLRSCVGISGHSTSGIEATAATVILAGATITGNYYGIRGESVTLQRRLNSANNKIRNTLGRLTYPAGSSRFFSLRYAPGTPIPQVDLTHNGWVQNGSAATPDPSWFCSYETNNFCVQGANTTSPNGGCGTECDSPSCPQFCVAYPNDPGCETEVPGTVEGPFRGTGPGTTLYPNPARDYVVVDGLSGTSVKVEVYTAGGKLVLEVFEKTPGPTVEINTANLLAGSYIVAVEQAPEDSSQKKGAAPTRTRHRLAIMK